MTNTPDRDHVQRCLDHCVTVSNWHFEDERFDEAKRWHDMAVEWQNKLNALDGKPLLATRESA